MILLRFYFQFVVFLTIFNQPLISFHIKMPLISHTTKISFNDICLSRQQNNTQKQQNTHSCPINLQKMKSSYKTSPKTIIDEIKKRRQTINITESQYNLPQKYRSPKTEKKQPYFIKELKTQQKNEKSSKITNHQSKKSQRTNSLAPYENDLTPKKLFQYHIDSSQSKYRPMRKIHSISLVDTPKKLNLRKKTQDQLFTVKQEQNREGCKKVVSAYKLNSSKGYSKPLRIESVNSNGNNRGHDLMEQNQDGGLKSSHNRKMYPRNCENYDIYYNEGQHDGRNIGSGASQHKFTPDNNYSSRATKNQNSTSNSSSHLRSSKKVKLPVQHHPQNSNTVLDPKQKSSSRTLRITRNSRSSNNDHQEQYFKKNSSNIINSSSKNNTKSQKGMKSPRVEEFDLHEASSDKEKRFQQMFFKCSLILKKYNHEIEKLKGENELLVRENHYLRASLSQKAL